MPIGIIYLAPDFLSLLRKSRNSGVGDDGVNGSLAGTLLFLKPALQLQTLARLEEWEIWVSAVVTVHCSLGMP